MPYQENKDFYILLKKIDFCFEKGLPFSIYRKPSEDHVKGIFQSNDQLHTTIDFRESGFVFAPFLLDNNAVLITADEVSTASFEAETQPSRDKLVPSDLGKDIHLNLVKKGIDKIGKGVLKKVVLSRKVDVKHSRKATDIFRSLLENYPNAFCYLFFHPVVGIWCGATPETLLAIKGKQLKTMSLAATLPFEEGVRPNWGSKEIEEQEMVSSYIEERLSKNLKRLDIGTAKAIKAGGLWHLKSEIKGVLSEDSSVEEIISTLHPTPAICGIPMDAAKDFILANENYSRSFYTGFLGELNLNEGKEAHLFVNLRCMELTEGNASIFVGGGITSASNPENEWTETQNKSKTMLKVL